MGPRLFRRGNGKIPYAVDRMAEASMGPRLFRRGNVREHQDRFWTRRLQWGHVFSDVEMAGAGEAPTGGGGRFNGATSFQTWKFLAIQDTPEKTVMLQWGHVFSDVEMTEESRSPSV